MIIFYNVIVGFLFSWVMMVQMTATESDSDEVYCNPKFYNNISQTIKYWREYDDYEPHPAIGREIERIKIKIKFVTW